MGCPRILGSCWKKGIVLHLCLICEQIPFKLGGPMSAIPSGSAAAAAIATPAGAAKPAPEFLTPGGDSKVI